MASRREIRNELNKRAVILPNMKGKQYSAKEKEEYFEFVRRERIRTGGDPSEKIISALKKANVIIENNKTDSETETSESETK